jgi:(p)ppGpp synthase/HD superfamily hydrolase
MIIQAASFAAQAHKDQKRKYSGEPYINHPLRVAAILEDLHFPQFAIAAALLHDVVEDCNVGELDLLKEFGHDITRTVMGVTNPSQTIYPEGSPNRPNRAARKAMDREWLAKGDYFIHSLKLADMIDNLASILEEDKDFAHVYVKEKKQLLPLLQNGHIGLYKQVEKILENASAELYGTGSQ